MRANALAALVGGLMAAGVLLALAFSRWMSRQEDRRALLMSSVAAWFILVGMVPFVAFAVAVNAAGRGNVSGPASLVLNLVPFALVASPFAGFVHGMLLRGKSKQ